MISTLLFQIIVAIVVVALAVLVAFLAIRRYLALRGARLVTCPADNTRASVEVNALRSLLSGHQLQLQSCTHWPERERCGQDCLEQIENSPDGCLVRKALSAWYTGKVCALCGKPFGEIDWMEHRPCLLARDGRTKDWSRIQPLDLSETLATHMPVCWNCHIATTFRREFPELVTDRPTKR